MTRADKILCTVRYFVEYTMRPAIVYTLVTHDQLILNAASWLEEYDNEGIDTHFPKTLNITQQLKQNRRKYIAVVLVMILWRSAPIGMTG